MKRKLNPIYKKGSRNIFCPYYRECLNSAALKAWDYWTCFDCHYKRIESACTEGPYTCDDALPYRVPQEIYLKVG